jgi:membrane-associated phospholipid phosphatase
MVSLLFFVDQCLAKWISALPQTWMHFARALSFLAEPSFHSIFWPLLAVVVRRPPFIHLGIATFLSGSFVTIIKNLVGRSRPSLFLENETFTSIGFTLQDQYHSFPSGHAALSFAIATSLAIQFPKWSPLCFSLATLISTCRLFLGAHYLTDILGGTLLAIALTYAINPLIGTLWTKNTPTTPSTLSF